MTPYYERGGIAIIHGDCREILPTLVYDSVLTDPPYGKQVFGPSDSQATFTESSEWLASLVVPTMFTVPVLALWNIPKPQWVAVWHKPQSFGFWSTPMYPHWEPIVMYRMPGKALRPDIFTCNPQPPNGHPTPKPLVLWLALLLCLPGIVADPYMGSGTTLLAAKILGRRAIGIEIEERYCELAATRLAQDVLPLSESVDATPTQTTL